MRVLHIDTGRQMRGGQHQVLLLHDSLASTGCRQVLLAGDAIRSRRPTGRATWQAIRCFARECDVIHAHDARAHTLAVLHGRGRPVVVSRRVAFPVGRGFGSVWKYRRAAHFIAISMHVRSVLMDGRVPAEKISVVYDAAPAAASLPDEPGTRERDGAEGAEPFRVVSPNFQDPLKGRELALAACRSAGMRLHLSDDLPDDLRSADALLYLTKTEGLGSAILLAMSLGVPAIASNVGGIPEIVSDGATGLLVENDIESVTSALRRLRDDPSLRECLAAAAQSRAQAEFSAETMAERTVAVYRQVLERGSGS